MFANQPGMPTGPACRDDNSVNTPQLCCGHIKPPELGSCLDEIESAAKSILNSFGLFEYLFQHVVRKVSQFSVTYPEFHFLNLGIWRCTCNVRDRNPILSQNHDIEVI